MKTNIVLIGFMGTGKTAVGRLLAEKLGWKFIEMDLLIEKKAGKTIPEIFEQDGEITFRELEIEATKGIASDNHSVIACGGGIVLNKINIDRLREKGRTVYLTTSPGVILKRVASEKGQRPLLEVENPTRTVSDLMKYRKPFYEPSADITINTSNLSIQTVAEQIIKELKKDESFDL